MRKEPLLNDPAKHSNVRCRQYGQIHENLVEVGIGSVPVENALSRNFAVQRIVVVDFIEPRRRLGACPTSKIKQVSENIENDRNNGVQRN
jgi:hypothetical protein